MEKKNDKNNMILFNLAESSSDNPEKRKKDDAFHSTPDGWVKNRHQHR